MRPKKPRLVDGVQLADSLYLDPRKRPGYYQYKFPDGRMSVFRAESPEQANTIAAEALDAFKAGVGPSTETAGRNHTSYHAERYIKEFEKLNPKKSKGSKWIGARYAIRKFAREYEWLQNLTREVLQTWWDDLTYHQQRTRHTAFRRWFNWMDREGLTPALSYNPFTLNDAVPRLLLKEKPDKQAPPLSQLAYWKIHKAAGELGYEACQIGMGISLYTTMREGDIVSMKLKANVVDGELRRVIGKSEAMHGEHHAARLCWRLSEHPRLKALIDRARELALKNKGCPFIISHTPKRRAWNEGKEHICQVRGERLYRMFIEARDHAGVKEKVTFHSVRGLSSTLYKIAGYGEEQIQQLMAHEDVDTTRGYMNVDDLPYLPMTMKLDMEL